MIHQPLGGFQGQASDIEIHAREILYLRSRLNDMLAKHTGQPLERIEKDTDRDNFPSATWAAVEYGLVDKVLTSRDRPPAPSRRTPSDGGQENWRRENCCTAPSAARASTRCKS